VKPRTTFALIALAIISILIAGASSAHVGTHEVSARPSGFDDPPPPPPIHMRDHSGQSVLGSQGGYCWTSGCIDPDAPLPASVLLVQTGDCATFEVESDPVPTSFEISVYRIDPGADDATFTFEERRPVMEMRVEDRSILGLTSDTLGPGRYAIRAFVYWEGKGDNLMVFRLDVQEPV
jgi:hypothetical protein